MHELSIAQNLLDIVSAQCLKDGFKEIEAVNINIGKASGIMPEALSFAFEAIKADTIAQNACLNISVIPLTAFCKDCNDSFTVEEEYVLCCPVCQGTTFVMTAGRELDIVDMEVS